MRWNDRQQAMLREIGVRLWLPDDPTEPTATQPGEVAAAANAEAPVSVVSRSAMATPPMSVSPVSAPVPTALSPTHPPPSIPSTDSRGGRPTIATLDWPALEAAVSGCTACGLCRTRRQTVFGVGHRQAHCMVVGEAPGEQEDLKGEPFVGSAGQLLDRMLAAIGLTRGEAPPAQQVFIANALKCRPPGNRNPTPEEMAHCVPFLERQAALVQPRVILAMGRFAVQSLLQTDEAIGRLRGRVHQWQGRPLVVTYHPAYLLRQPADKAKAWDDLCLAAELLERGEG